MSRRTSYGSLIQISDDMVEFTVNGRIQQTWNLRPPIETMAGLVQNCLASLANEGWRPISHQQGHPVTIVLARVPYTAGSKLSIYGTLRHLGDGSLILTVGGAIMRRWANDGVPSFPMEQALAELERDGWRIHRRYPSGATVVRG